MLQHRPPLPRRSRRGRGGHGATTPQRTTGWKSPTGGAQRSVASDPRTGSVPSKSPPPRSSSGCCSAPRPPKDTATRCTRSRSMRTRKCCGPGRRLPTSGSSRKASSSWKRPSTSGNPSVILQPGSADTRYVTAWRCPPTFPPRTCTFRACSPGGHRAETAMLRPSRCTRVAARSPSTSATACTSSGAKIRHSTRFSSARTWCPTGSETGNSRPCEWNAGYTSGKQGSTTLSHCAGATTVKAHALWHAPPGPCPQTPSSSLCAAPERGTRKCTVLTSPRAGSGWWAVEPSTLTRTRSVDSTIPSSCSSTSSSKLTPARNRSTGSSAVPKRSSFVPKSLS
mmetsp:Transcript_34788/g.97624  ORF Transcript_34788/g.97624 Transcript_34788/m.97624 type:complete len:339 (+) Transcript_34788:221-1237(+)